MSSFRANKNPPWARNASTGISGMAGMQGGMGMQQQNMFQNTQFAGPQNQQLQLANQQQLALQQQQQLANQQLASQQLASQQLANQQLASQQMASQQMAAMGVGGMSQAELWQRKRYIRKEKGYIHHVSNLFKSRRSHDNEIFTFILQVSEEDFVWCRSFNPARHGKFRNAEKNGFYVVVDKVKYVLTRRGEGPLEMRFYLNSTIHVPPMSGRFKKIRVPLMFVESKGNPVYDRRYPDNGGYRDDRRHLEERDYPDDRSYPDRGDYPEDRSYYGDDADYPEERDYPDEAEYPDEYYDEAPVLEYDDEPRSRHGSDHESRTIHVDETRCDKYGYISNVGPVVTQGKGLDYFNCDLQVTADEYTPCVVYRTDVTWQKFSDLEEQDRFVKLENVRIVQKHGQDWIYFYSHCKAEVVFECPDFEKIDAHARDDPAWENQKDFLEEDMYRIEGVHDGWEGRGRDRFEGKNVGYVHNVSSMKLTSDGRRYFLLDLQVTETEFIHVNVYAPGIRMKLITLAKLENFVSLENVQTIRTRDGYYIRFLKRSYIRVVDDLKTFEKSQGWDGFEDPNELTTGYICNVGRIELDPLKNRRYFTCQLDVPDQKLVNMEVFAIPQYSAFKDYEADETLIRLLNIRYWHNEDQVNGMDIIHFMRSSRVKTIKETYDKSRQQNYEKFYEEEEQDWGESAHEPRRGESVHEPRRGHSRSHVEEERGHSRSQGETEYDEVSDEFEEEEYAEDDPNYGQGRGRTRTDGGDHHGHSGREEGGGRGREVVYDGRGESGCEDVEYDRRSGSRRGESGYDGRVARRGEEEYGGRPDVVYVDGRVISRRVEENYDEYFEEGLHDADYEQAPKRGRYDDERLAYDEDDYSRDVMSSSYRDKDGYEEYDDRFPDDFDPYDGDEGIPQGEDDYEELYEEGAHEEAYEGARDGAREEEFEGEYGEENYDDNEEELEFDEIPQPQFMRTPQKLGSLGRLGEEPRTGREFSQSRYREGDRREFSQSRHQDGDRREFSQSRHQDGDRREFSQSRHQDGDRREFSQSRHQDGNRREFSQSGHQDGVGREFSQSGHQDGDGREFSQSGHQTGHDDVIMRGDRRRCDERNLGDDRPSRDYSPLEGARQRGDVRPFRGDHGDRGIHGDDRRSRENRSMRTDDDRVRDDRSTNQERSLRDKRLNHDRPISQGRSTNEGRPTINEGRPTNEGRSTTHEGRPTNEGRSTINEGRPVRDKRPNDDQYRLLREKRQDGLLPTPKDRLKFPPPSRETVKTNLKRIRSQLEGKSSTGEGPGLSKEGSRLESPSNTVKQTPTKSLTKPSSDIKKTGTVEESTSKKKENESLQLRSKPLNPVKKTKPDVSNDNKKPTVPMEFPNDNKKPTVPMKFPNDNKKLTVPMKFPNDNKKPTVPMKLPNDNKKPTVPMKFPNDNKKPTVPMKLPNDNKKPTVPMEFPNDNKELTVPMEFPIGPPDPLPIVEDRTVSQLLTKNLSGYILNVGSLQEMRDKDPFFHCDFQIAMNEFVRCTVFGRPKYEKFLEIDRRNLFAKLEYITYFPNQHGGQDELHFLSASKITIMPAPLFEKSMKKPAPESVNVYDHRYHLVVTHKADDKKDSSVSGNETETKLPKTKPKPKPPQKIHRIHEIRHPRTSSVPTKKLEFDRRDPWSGKPSHRTEADNALSVPIEPKRASGYLHNVGPIKVPSKPGNDEFFYSELQVSPREYYHVVCFRAHLHKDFFEWQKRGVFVTMDNVKIQTKPLGTQLLFLRLSTIEPSLGLATFERGTRHTKYKVHSSDSDSKRPALKDVKVCHVVYHEDVKVLDVKKNVIERPTLAKEPKGYVHRVGPVRPAKRLDDKPYFFCDLQIAYNTDYDFTRVVIFDATLHGYFTALEKEDKFVKFQDVKIVRRELGEVVFVTKNSKIMIVREGGAYKKKYPRKTASSSEAKKESESKSGEEKRSAEKSGPDRASREVSRRTRTPDRPSDKRDERGDVRSRVQKSTERMELSGDRRREPGTDILDPRTDFEGFIHCVGPVKPSLNPGADAIFYCDLQIAENTFVRVMVFDKLNHPRFIEAEFHSQHVRVEQVRFRHKYWGDIIHFMRHSQLKVLDTKPLFKIKPGIALPTTLGTTPVPTVSYPTPRLNQPPQAPVPAPQQQQQQQQAQKQRVFTGVVTKLHDNFGFVDDDVFFPANCVKGSNPKVGDRVLVEASYNANMPFKWSATRIQVLPNQGGTVPQGQTAVTGHTASLGGMKQTMNTPYVNQPGHMQTNLMAQQQAGLMTMRENRPAGRMDRPARGMDRERPMRDRRRSPPKRERSPKRSRSPRRSPTRSTSSRCDARKAGPRYSVQIPKISMDVKDGSVQLLRARYTNMYIPSDFFRAKFTWLDAFPPNRPQSLAHECGYHIMHRESQSVVENDAVLEPSDASHLYSAKVMLLALPGLLELYRRSCSLAEEESRDSHRHDSYRHPTRMIQFLVGLKGKGEPLAIGGPWSASLDGPDPKDDPTVLINTAKRTCKALTGIDLSACTQWYRFAEIQYHRGEETRKGRHLPARVETTVIFLPDIWSCVPSSLEWETLQTQYLQLVSSKETQEEEEKKEEEEGDEEGVEADVKEEEKKPTHHSELDLKIMKVAEIRYELEARKMNAKGMKAQLLARLTKAVKLEKEEEEEAQEQEQEEDEDEEQMETTEENEEADEGDTSQDAEKVETDKDVEVKKTQEEEPGERTQLDPETMAEVERLYKLPNNRAIIVHPNKEAKGGKFDCTVMSLSVLLDYRPEDNKEHSFEVSIFAELFNEMIMRDFGFNIYKALTAAPEKEEKKEKKEDKDEKEVKRRKLDEDEEKKDATPKKEDDTPEQKDNDKPEEETKVKEEDSERRRHRDSREPDDVRTSGTQRSDDVRTAGPLRTVDPQLLLSCVYFDLNHCGYLNEKDLEEIFHTLGLQISRGQIHRLVEKVCVKDEWHYRKFTDRPLTETPAPVLPQAVDTRTLATGNNCLIDNQQLGPAQNEGTSTASPRRIKQERGDRPNVVGDSGMVMYRGALVDVGGVMDKLQQCDLEKTKLESKLATGRNELEKIKEAHVDDLTTITNLRKQIVEKTSESERLEHHVQNLTDTNLTLAEFARSVRNLAEDVETTVGNVLDPDDSLSDAVAKERLNGDHGEVQE